MINKHVTLILGAGASEPYGFPTGGKLVEQALNIDPGDEPYLDRIGVGQGDLKEFQQVLGESLAGSIDAFLETRPDFEPIGKRMIAGLLIPREAPNVLMQRGRWYYELRQLLHARTPEEWTQNCLKIVTFNYDRSLEYALLRALQATYRLNQTEAAEVLSAVPIVHVHGTLGELPGINAAGLGNERPYSAEVTEDALAVAMNSIKIIHDGQLDNSQDFNQARTLISRSESVLFLGFGYNATNVRRLQLDAYLAENAQLAGTARGFTRSQFDLLVRSQFTALDQKTVLSSQAPDLTSDVLTWLNNNLRYLLG